MQSTFYPYGRPIDRRVLDTLVEELTHLLCPFNVSVSVWPSSDRDAEIRLEMVVMNSHSLLYGRRLSYIYRLTEYDFYDRHKFEWLPKQLARQFMDEMLNSINKVRLPPADEIDWRPMETVPEDYYSA